MMDATSLAEEFPLQDGIIYLDHAAVAPWPRRTAEAVIRFAQENITLGASNYDRWVRVETTLREQLREAINAPSAADIALLKNTSEGLSFIANGIDWSDGDNVVSSNEEFPSNRMVWEWLQERGVALKQIALVQAGKSPEEALMDAADARTRLIAVSSVQYASGLRVDLESLGAFCRSRGILLCVDAIQSLGALALDVQTCRADFVVADAHKWMLGPEGIALFYVGAEIRDRLRLSEYGWHMAADYSDYDRKDWIPAHSARRFECGSPNMLGIHAFSASLSLILEIGVDEIQRRILKNTQYLTEWGLASEGLELVSPRAAAQQSGIVSFRPKAVEARSLFRVLREGGVVCALRGGAIRFSPHFYTPRDMIDAALELTASVI